MYAAAAIHATARKSVIMELMISFIGHFFLRHSRPIISIIFPAPPQLCTELQCKGYMFLLASRVTMKFLASFCSFIFDVIDSAAGRCEFCDPV